MSSSTVNVTMTAVLTDISSNPLAGQSIVFSYKATTSTTFTTVGSSTTDTTGTATFIVQLAAPGAYNLDATFNGTSLYAGSDSLITFDTSVGGTTQTSLTVAVSAVVQPDGSTTATVTATLTTTSGGVSGQFLQVYLDGVLLGNTPSPTDTNGQATFQIPNVTTGTHIVSVAFQGTASYSASQSQSSFSTGVAASGIGWLAGAGIVGVVVVGALVSRLRKRR